MLSLRLCRTVLVLAMISLTSCDQSDDDRSATPATTTKRVEATQDGRDGPPKTTKRVAQESSAPPSSAQGTASTAGSATATAEAPRPDPPPCLVPLPDEAPPTAEPAEQCPKDPGSERELDRGWVIFEDAPGAPRVFVEHARTPAARRRGLMYRTSLGEDEGMLFTWPREAIRSFWMRNTCIPLDMMFLSEDGLILGIIEQVPVLNERSRSIPCPAAHVLEVNAGWSRAHGIEPGQRVELDL